MRELGNDLVRIGYRSISELFHNERVLDRIDDSESRGTEPLE